MDLTDAVRRVLLQHARLIAAFVLLGVVGGVAIATLKAPQYTSSARVILDAQISEAPESATAVSDRARAIVTSRGFAEEALRDVGVPRDPAALVRSSIRVEPLGTSSTLEIAVSDRDPSVAAAVANALSTELVRRWPEASGERTSEVISYLEQRIDAINADVIAVNEEITRLSVKLAQPDGLADQNLTAQRDVAISRRDEFVQLRAAFQAQMGSMLVEQASQFEPRVLDRAVPAADPDPSNALPIVALGALVAGFLGIGAAATVESLRPTVVGANSIADELDVPVLGQLSMKSKGSLGQSERLALRLRLAAATAKVDTVELVSVEPSVDLSRLQEAVQSSEALGPARRRGNVAARELVVLPFGSDLLSRNGHSNGARQRALVALVPTVIKRSRLREIRDLQSMTTWPLIGIVTYPRTRRPFRSLRAREDVIEEIEAADL